jgi:hypothetical protein
MLVGGCAVVAAAGTGVGLDVHSTPEAKKNTNVLPTHVSQHNHTHSSSTTLIYPRARLGL